MIDNSLGSSRGPRDSDNPLATPPQPPVRDAYVTGIVVVPKSGAIQL
jgi:hypothetical protein